MTFLKNNFYIFLIFIAFSSCNSHAHTIHPSIQQKTAINDYQTSSLSGLENLKNPQTPKEKRKILYAANMEIVSPLPDSINPQLEHIAEKYGGYIGYLSTRQTTIRIKSQEFENVIVEIEKLGKITRKNIVGNDVTEEYWDAQIRLDNALETRKRYIELLKMAKNVEEAILVERELARVSENIDLLKGKLNKLDNLEEFATITITIREKAKLGLIGYVGVGLYKTIKWFFVRN